MRTPASLRRNWPSITLEVDPNREGVGANFASLVFFPPAIVPLVWSDYIDATAEGRLGRHRFGVRRHAV